MNAMNRLPGSVNPGVMNAMGRLPGSVNPGVMNAMGRLPGTSPFKRIALSAIEANSIGKQGRDVSMRSTADNLEKLTDELSNLDDEKKAEVAKVVETVRMKA